MVINIHGNEFNSIKEACKHYKVSYDMEKTYKQRYKELSHEQIILMLCNMKKSNINILGSKYKSVKEACDILGIDYRYIKVIKTRYKFKTLEAALRAYVRVNITEELKTYNDAKGAQSVNIDGVDYDSISSACKDLSISEASVYKQMRKGISPEESIKYLLELKKLPSKYELVINGEKYRTLSSIVKVTGIKYSTLIKYIHNSNKNIEHCIMKYNPNAYINWLGELVIPT